MDDQGQPLIEPGDVLSSTIQSNLAFYARMSHGQIVNPEQIRAAEGGANADYGASKVRFPADLYHHPVQVITPEGKVLKFRPSFLSWPTAARESGTSWQA